MAWIELHQAVWTHRKTFVLADALSMDATAAVAYLLRLWCWALDNAIDGNLGILPASVIARGAGWPGDEVAFVTALVSAGWLDREDTGSLKIHDWQDYAGRLVSRRQEEAERKRIWRNGPPDVPTPSISPDADRTRTGRGPDADRTRTGRTRPVYRTVPYRTGPETLNPPNPPSSAGVVVDPLENAPSAAASAAEEPRPPEPEASRRPAPLAASAPKPAPKPNRVTQVATLLTAAEVPFTLTNRDGAAIKHCSAPAALIADAYLAACNRQWDPGGTGWLLENLSVHAVIERLAGYQASRNGASDVRPIKRGTRARHL